MQIIGYSPGGELSPFESDLEKDMEKILENRRLTRPALFQDLSTVDMYIESGKLTVVVTLPGFTKDEIRIKTDRDALDITAEHVVTEDEKVGREYLLHESSRIYHRHIVLPAGVKPETSDAVFADGKLTITMPIERQMEAKEVAIK